jgi:acyl-CoA reductase-like NAD-dependent aldehyde dehydrogenase
MESEEARAMSDLFPMMIPGARAEGAPLAVHAPYDGSLIATVERAGPAGVAAALETADRLFRDRDAWLGPARRIEILTRAASLLEERREDLALEASREGGKPLRDSLVEADRAADSLRSCVERLRTAAGREIPMNINAASAGRVAFTRREPVGVVLAFSAFNHPLNLIAHQVGPAVAAGCPVIVKPAEATPLSCWRFVAILREAGLPDAWCQPLLATDLDVAGSMVSDPRVGFFSFIGSSKIRVDAPLSARPRGALRARARRGGPRSDRGRRRSGERRAPSDQRRVLPRRTGVRLRPADLRP